jgi:hypothetical protein
MKNSPVIFWNTIFWLTLCLQVIVLIWSVLRWVALKVILWRSDWLMVLIVYLIALVGWVGIYWWGRIHNDSMLVARLKFENYNTAFFRIIGLLFFIVILAGIPWIKFKLEIILAGKQSTLDPILSALLFFWVTWWLLLLATTAIKVALRTSFVAAIAITLTTAGIVYELFTRLSAVSSYPFSLGWSESSRYYFSSLLFSDSIYGQQISWTSKSPARYLLQAIPFLIHGLPLWAHRFWQYFLWVGLAGGTALSLAKRVLPNQRGMRLLFAGWVMLYLLGIGVYYHLEVIVILILFGVSRHYPWRTFVLIIIASAWAGISRFNWYPVPAMLAIVIYVLEEPLSSYKNIQDYLRKPFAWALAGTATAFLIQVIYIKLIKVTDLRAVTSSFNSDLLWYRLLPNESFSPGILLGIVLFSLPIWIALVQIIRGRTAYLKGIRWFILGSILLVLFVGGLVVSVKIGGGGDLHNMDAYIILLLVILAYFMFGLVKSDVAGSNWGQASLTTLICGLFVPLLFLLPTLSPLPQYDEPKNDLELAKLNRFVAQVRAQNGEVLFISERSLLTFEMVRDVPLVPDYEVTTLMEMAMSNNQQYLGNFYHDLQNHRFAAIIAGKQNLGTKDISAFAEENNVWNTRVAAYIFCYYQPALLLEPDFSKIEIFVPRTEAACP